jgi:hypothetical protein
VDVSIKQITVRALPRSFDAEYRRVVGENLFCGLWDSRLAGTNLDDATCSGAAEVELVVAHTAWRETRHVDEAFVVLLCREHAGYIGKQLTEAVELADGADLFRGR